MLKMIFQIDPIKSAGTALISAAAGSFSNYITVPAYFIIENVNTAFQHAAWTVAILAGIVSIVNGVKNWKIFNRKNREL